MKGFVKDIESIAVKNEAFRRVLYRDGVVHDTRAEAEADNEHFDGKTTE